MIPLFYVVRHESGRLRLTGRDRQSFLQGMVTNDVASLASGQGCYTFLLDATGHVLADARVMCTYDHLLLDVEPGMATFVAETLDRYLIMERCRITDVSDEIGQVFVGGTRVPDVLARLGATNAQNWAEGQNEALPIAGQAALVAATRLIPGPGFDIYLPEWRSTEGALLAELDAANAVELSADALDAYRIEAGVPRFGIDIDARVLAPETGQQRRAIHYNKGCYIGQEIVARIHARGHTNRTFAGFLLDRGAASDLPTSGTPVIAPDGKEIGRVTSAAVSPTLNQPIALGYIRHGHSEPGTTIMVADRPATVAALPFVPSPAEQGTSSP